MMSMLSVSSSAAHGLERMARDLSLADASLRRVFSIMQQAGVLGRDLPFEPAKFVDESYLAESRK
jgi:hypothetical protein